MRILSGIVVGVLIVTLPAAHASGSKSPAPAPVVEDPAAFDYTFQSTALPLAENLKPLRSAPAQSHYEWTDLSAVQAAAHHDPIQMAFNSASFGGFASILIKRADQLDATLHSWLFLLSASERNPLFSVGLRKMRDGNSACVSRVLLTEIDLALKQIPADMAAAGGRFGDNAFLQRLLLENLLGRKNFSVLNSRSQLRGTEYERVSGTEYTIPSGQVLATYAFLNELLYPKSDVQKYLFSSSLACERQFDLIELFPWFDLQLLNEQIASNTSESDLALQLDNIIATSFAPDFSPVLETTAPISPDEFALRPNLGQLLIGSNLPRQFYRAVFDVIIRRATDESGYLTANTCRSVSQAVRWASLLGVHVENTAAAQARAGIDQELFERLVRVMAAHIGALKTNNPEVSAACSDSLLGIESLWDSYVHDPAKRYNAYTFFSNESIHFKSPANPTLTVTVKLPAFDEGHRGARIP